MVGKKKEKERKPLQGEGGNQYLGVLETAGDGGGRHTQDVGLHPESAETLFLFHSEALFFVDDDQTEVAESESFTAEPVSTDENINAAG